MCQPFSVASERACRQCAGKCGEHNQFVWLMVDDLQHTDVHIYIYVMYIYIYIYRERETKKD
jgi:hypothetical protein